MKKLSIFILLFSLTFQSILAQGVQNQKVKEDNTKKIIQEINQTGYQFVFEEDYPLFQEIINLKTEEERRKVFDEKKGDITPEVIKNKSKEIFDKFDLYFANIDQALNDIESNLEVLKQAQVDLDGVDVKIKNLKLKILKAKKDRAYAWLKLNEVDLSKSKKEIEEEIAEVKFYLVKSRVEIKEVLIEMKEVIYFLKGVVINLK